MVLSLTLAEAPRFGVTDTWGRLAGRAGKPRCQDQAGRAGRAFVRLGRGRRRSMSGPPRGPVGPARAGQGLPRAGGCVRLWVPALIRAPARARAAALVTAVLKPPKP